MFDCKAIGYFHCSQAEKYMAPKQPEFGLEEGRVVLVPDQNFEQALQDLIGFEHIWLLYWFDRNQTWKPKVTTPRGGPKRGLFATRSPHRPNPIGMSCVKLLSVEGRELCVGKNDLLDGTPILDIKPYLNYADAFPDSRQGWIEDAYPEQEYVVRWSEESHLQAQFIQERSGLHIKEAVDLRLRHQPYPFPNHRIRKVSEDRFELAVKTWRVYFSLKNLEVLVHQIRSGYDSETLSGLKPSQWDDVPLHRLFIDMES